MAERWRTRFASSEAVHQKMSTLARRDTAPELALRRVLHRRGLRYRVHRRPLPDLARQADIVFPGAKVAVFVDGCFWHGCPDHGRREHRTNGWYWPNKVAANKDRDRDTDERLIAAGWIPVRVWEHEQPDKAADRVAGAIAGNCCRPWTRTNAGQPREEGRIGPPTRRTARRRLGLGVVS